MWKLLNKIKVNIFNIKSSTLSPSSTKPLQSLTESGSSQEMCDEAGCSNLQIDIKWFSEAQLKSIRLHGALGIFREVVQPKFSTINPNTNQLHRDQILRKMKDEFQQFVFILFLTKLDRFYTNFVYHSKLYLKSKTDTK